MMRRWKTVPAVAVLLVLLFACSLQSPWNGTTTGGEAALPPDTISDVARSYGEFTYETLLPVTLNLEVELYESSAGGKNLDELPPQEHLVLVTLRDAAGEAVYSSRVPGGGSLSAVIPLPAAPEDLTLSLEAPGFQSRRVTIRDMVGLAEVNRVMGLLSDGLAPKGEAAIDTDGDGIPDAYDAYPLDPDVAFTVRYPAQGSLTVAYEDLFPKPGDADFNDFVAEYTVTEHYANVETIQEVSKDGGTTETIEKIVLLTSLHGEATAIDKVAGYDHKFGIVIDFPGQTAKSIDVDYYDSAGQPRSLTLAAVQDQAILWLFENTKYAKGKAAHFDIYFDSKGVSREKVSYPPYDPVLMVLSSDSRKRYDIHLIGQDPLPGSVNPLGEDFLDDNFFPWALLVPDDWAHPAECQYIGRAYPLFDAWVDSEGADFAYWYLYPAATNTKEDNEAPYPVTGPTTTPVFTVGTAASFQLDIDAPAGEPDDPDGNRVYYRSSQLPAGLVDKAMLNEQTGLVSFDDTVEADTYLVYFWSEDEFGASTIADPYKVSLTFEAATNAAPSAVFEEPAITGSMAIGGTLTGHYTYSDPDGDAESGSLYQWYRFDSATATTGGTAIPGATALSYTSTAADSGKWLRLEVTPVDAKGAAGTAVLSEAAQINTRVVIDTFVPSAFNENDTYLILIDAVGTILAEDDDGNPDQTNHRGCSRIDMVAGLPGGTYYVSVHKPTDAGNPNYGLRVADYDPGAVFPAIDPANEEETVSDDEVDPYGVPTAPVDISIPGVTSRSIYPEEDDVDWFRFVLP